MQLNDNTSHPSAFISSTFLDLEKERRAVDQTLAHAGVYDKRNRMGIQKSLELWQEHTSLFQKNFEPPEPAAARPTWAYRSRGRDPSRSLETIQGHPGAQPFTEIF